MQRVAETINSNTRWIWKAVIMMMMITRFKQIQNLNKNVWRRNSFFVLMKLDNVCVYYAHLLISLV